MSTHYKVTETTVGELRRHLFYDQATGVFTWLLRPRKGVQVGAVAGCLSGGRRVIRIGKRRYLAHRLAWFYVHGQWPDHQIDHINGDPLDNRMENLRDVPQSINLQNQRRARLDSRSGLLGVHPTKKSGRWAAQIRTNGLVTHLGTFGSKEEGHAAYLSAKRQLHEGNQL